jgi:type IV conjugative transfer system protein TraE
MHKKVKERFLSLNKLQRNHLAGIVVVLFMLNIMLIIKVFNQDELVILVPNSMGTFYNTTDNQEAANKYNRFAISRSKISKPYLEGITRDAVRTMLEITPNNVDYATKSILSMVHPSSYGEIKSYLYKVTENVKKKKTSTSFYIASIQINNDDINNLKSLVEGDLVTYLGKEEVSRKRTKYSIGFLYNGKLSLTEFVELSKEDEENEQ